MHFSKTFLAKDMVRGKHFADMKIEIGSKLPAGFTDCTLERCHVILRGLTPSIQNSRLTDCVIECTKRITARRLPTFFSSDYVRCKFLGWFEGVDFGRSPWPDEATGEFDEFGAVEDCDFTDATLNLCRFFSVDVNRQRFAPWPQFVIHGGQRLAAFEAAREWPGELSKYFRLGRSEPAAVTAVTGIASDFTRRFAVTLEELEQALDIIGGVTR